MHLRVPGRLADLLLPTSRACGKAAPLAFLGQARTREGVAPRQGGRPRRDSALWGCRAGGSIRGSSSQCMSSQIDLGYLSGTMWTLGLGAVGAAVTGFLLANSDVCLPKAEKASLEFLEEIELKTVEQGEPRPFKASELWMQNGAVVMAEATELSSLKPTLDQLGVPLYAVVKENIGNEVEDFQPYFKGEIFLDEKKGFYGPRRRKMLFMALFRCGVWRNFYRAWKGGFSGNLDGEGVILGGVYVIGPGKQGVLLEHREKEFGDKVSLDAVLEAVKKIKTKPSDHGESKP